MKPVPPLHAPGVPAEVSDPKFLPSQNGDTLAALENREADLRESIKVYRAHVEEAEARLQPWKELLGEREMALMNVLCRKAIWMAEHGRKLP